MRAAGTPGAALAAAAVALLTVAACSEGGLTSVPDAETPGQAAETQQVTVPVAELAAWRDTSYTGYATAHTVGYTVTASSGPLTARALYSLLPLPDSVSLDAERLAIDSVRSMQVLLVPDTTRTSLPADSFTLRARLLARDFDPAAVTWTQAAAGEPWASPGGDFGPEAGRAKLLTLADTVEVPVSLDPDSAYRAWGEQEDPPGLALEVDGGATRLAVVRLLLRLRVVPADRDTVVDAFTPASGAAFIFDPEQAPPGGELRLGGLPSGRIYLAFVPSDSVRGVALRGARLNRAELVFHPSPDVPAHFRLRRPMDVLAFRLLGDPIEFGPKVPVGDALQGRSVYRLRPDSLQAGVPLGVDVTEPVLEWLQLPPDSTPTLFLGVRPLPDGARFGFWDFGSTESPARRPELRLLFTPPTPFSLP